MTIRYFIESIDKYGELHPLIHAPCNSIEDAEKMIDHILEVSKTEYERKDLRIIKVTTEEVDG